MKSRRSALPDHDLMGAKRALERAAAEARRLAEQTGTPFYVLKDGRVVDLNGARSRRRSTRTASRKR